MEDELKLVFVKDIGENGSIYEYDFYFSHTPDDFWGIGFDCEFASQDNVIPDRKTYDTVLRLRTIIPLFCTQHNRCFSMSHVVDGILCVAFEDISEYDEYPEPYRIVFKYGESIVSVEEKLAGRHQFFDDQEPDI